MTDIISGLEHEVIRDIAKPVIDKMVLGWANNVDPVTHKPRPFISQADVPEIEDSLYKMLGVVFGLMAQNQEQPHP